MSADGDGFRLFRQSETPGPFGPGVLLFHRDKARKALALYSSPCSRITTISTGSTNWK